MPFFRSRAKRSEPPNASHAQPKTLADLEREIEAELQPQPSPARRLAHRQRSPLPQNLLIAALLVGLPLGVLWIANLPYTAIRRPIAEVAPALLLPSYIRFENDYRAAISLLAQAEQLLDQVTSFEDVDSGKQKVEQAQDRLDRLPIGFLSRYPNYSFVSYDWRFSRISFDQARATLGRLNAQVFQEENAQAALLSAEQQLESGKQRYSQATSPVDKDEAIADWQQAIDQLDQLPSTTLAGAIAQQKLSAYERDFGEVTGRIAGNQEANTLIQAAREFGWQAAKAADNPPHTAVQWAQIEDLWQAALLRLDRVPQQNQEGYTQAQAIAAQYQANLATVRVRRDAEVASVAAFQQAQRDITVLQADASRLSRDAVVSRLQGIVNRLQTVESGTTVYLEAQNLLLSAQNRLSQMR
ncbi:MAG: hypothetical protein WBA10_17765 [Elainellaceae cyanobacterium]